MNGSEKLRHTLIHEALAYHDLDRLTYILRSCGCEMRLELGLDGGWRCSIGLSNGRAGGMSTAKDIKTAVELALVDTFTMPMDG